MQFKKPKFWNLSKPNFISLFLLPLTIPVIINNFLLNKKPKQNLAKVKTICVGNIYIGGTGKTPTTIKLFGILKNLGLNTSTAKKFYKSQIDEKIMLENKTKLISEKTRLKIIEKSLENKCELLIFDDGLQDKSISYDLKFVCFNSENLIGNGLLIPAGPLREKIESLKKYDGVFIKNDNNINTIEFEKLIKKINQNIKIFYTNFEIKNLDQFDISQKYLIFSGIGNPENFRKTLLKNKFNIIDEIVYPDHFSYNENIINDIKNRAKKKDAKIITTEKDFAKISNLNHQDIKFLEVDLKINDEIRLINFIKTKIYE